jgi:predicted nucleotidyltransferase
MDLSENTDLRWLSGLIGDMRSVARGRDPLMVGAMARDLLLQYGAGVQIRRATTDVDLAFAVASWEEFGAFRNALLSSGLFNESRHEHKLLHKGTLEIDLIPYGGVEDAAGQIHWPASENLMSVLGYQEARATAVEIVLPDDQRISTVSLPMLAVMKFVAWSDRHLVQPRKDASDLMLILRNYLHGKNADRLYTGAAHLLEVDDFDFEVAAAWVAGSGASLASFIQRWSLRRERCRIF